MGTASCLVTSLFKSRFDDHVSLQYVCVIGDAYRYTIQPIFRDVTHDARCHVRRRRLNVLYELFFFIQLPRRSDTDDKPLFQTPKVYRTVWSAGEIGDPEYRSRGRYNADYLTVEHDAGIDLPDDVVLRRRTGSSNASRRPATRRRQSHDVFSVQRLDDGNDDNDDVIAVHEISRNIFVASTQFERPFDYSTSTWFVTLTASVFEFRLFVFTGFLIVYNNYI